VSGASVLEKLICTDISQQIADRYDGILLAFNPDRNGALRVAAFYGF
jgi:hypothetical protein